MRSSPPGTSATSSTAMPALRPGFTGSRSTRHCNSYGNSGQVFSSRSIPTWPTIADSPETDLANHDLGDQPCNGASAPDRDRADLLRPEAPGAVEAQGNRERIGHERERCETGPLSRRKKTAREHGGHAESMTMNDDILVLYYYRDGLTEAERARVQAALAGRRRPSRAVRRALQGPGSLRRRGKPAAVARRMSWPAGTTASNGPRASKQQRMSPGTRVFHLPSFGWGSGDGCHVGRWDRHRHLSSRATM